MKSQHDQRKQPLAILKHPTSRLIIALAWTVFITIMLLQSSAKPTIGPAIPPELPYLVQEFIFTIGHMVTFSVLVLSWWWALKPKLNPQRALFIAVSFALIFSVLTELGQSTVPDRNASFYDIAVNTTAIILTAAFINERWHKRNAVLPNAAPLTKNPPPIA